MHILIYINERTDRIAPHNFNYKIEVPYDEVEDPIKAREALSRVLENEHSIHPINDHWEAYDNVGRWISSSEI